MTKKPPPAIALCGLFSLKRNGIPVGALVKGGVPLGCQKFTSSGRRSDRNEYHPLSVTPTQNFILVSQSVISSGQTGVSEKTTFVLTCWVTLGRAPF